MRLIDVNNISFKEINKALKDLSWWCDTNEQDGVVYIPSSNLIKDIGRIKDYLEYIKQQPTAFDVDKVIKQLEELKEWEDVDGKAYYTMSEKQVINKAIKIVKAGGIDDN